MLPKRPELAAIFFWRFPKREEDSGVFAVANKLEVLVAILLNNPPAGLSVEKIFVINGFCASYFWILANNPVPVFVPKIELLLKIPPESGLVLPNREELADIVGGTSSEMVSVDSFLFSIDSLLWKREDLIFYLT